jgi:hypothetical protein
MLKLTPVEKVELIKAAASIAVAGIGAWSDYKRACCRRAHHGACVFADGSVRRSYRGTNRVLRSNPAKPPAMAMIQCVAS